MNPYVIPMKCSVCGGDAMGHASGPSHYLVSYRHTDPQVCARILERKRKKMEAESQKLKETLDKVRQALKEDAAHDI